MLPQRGPNGAPIAIGFLVLYSFRYFIYIDFIVKLNHEPAGD